MRISHKITVPQRFTLTEIVRSERCGTNGRVVPLVVPNPFGADIWRIKVTGSDRTTGQSRGLDSDRLPSVIN